MSKDIAYQDIALGDVCLYTMADGGELIAGVVSSITEKSIVMHNNHQWYYKTTQYYPVPRRNSHIRLYRLPIEQIHRLRTTWLLWLKDKYPETFAQAMKHDKSS